MDMDFSQETPEEKKLRLSGIVKVVTKAIPALAPVFPVLAPAAAVIGGAQQIAGAFKKN